MSATSYEPTQHIPEEQSYSRCVALIYETRNNSGNLMRCWRSICTWNDDVKCIL